MLVPAINSHQNTTILLVGHDSADQNRLRESFEESSYRVVSAPDAPSALRVSAQDHLDVVVVNVNSLEADAAALCRLLRAQPRTSGIVVIAFAASETSREEILASGVDDVLTTPFNAKDVISRTVSHLRAAQRESLLTGSNRELRFLADLGKGLLRAVEPQQLVKRLAGATYEGTGADLCAAYLMLDNGSNAACVFDREGSAEGISLLQAERVSDWLRSSVAKHLLERDKFLLQDSQHTVEYAAPLRFKGQTKGALIVAFDDRAKCGDTEMRLTDAAAQEASLAAHVSSLYQSARDSSVELAQEVERRTLEAEAQRRFTEAIIDSLPVSLYAVDRNYRVVAWNRNRELGELGIPRGSVLGRNVFHVLTRQKREVLELEFSRVFESGEIERIEQETLTAHGQTKHWLISKIPMWLDQSGKVSHVITVGEEITSRVEANRAVARAEKLAAVGRLASGVVHEINNPLATISACAEALESRVDDGDFKGSPGLSDLKEYLALIRSEAFRCKTITNGLLDFSRTRGTQHVPLSINDVISAAARLVSHQRRGEKVDIQIDSADDLPVVMGDEGQLQQAVIALATNALDAMPFGGVLKISARNDADKVLIEVSDTGIGIPAENLHQIFEPFFTTKEVGRGTGLGLAVCYGILTEHGGSLDVQSNVGVGTTFTISLPATSQDGDASR